MEPWTIEGDSKRYEGGADSSADVDYGFKFTVVRVGVAREINVERATGAEVELTEELARQAVADHLADEEPPSRVLMATDGRFHAS
jgi:hypothetical protein